MRLSRACQGFSCLAVAGLLGIGSLLQPLPAVAQAGLTVSVGQLDATGFPTIKAYVTVLDQAGLPLRDLPDKSFAVVEDSVPVADVAVASIQNTADPLALAIAIDLSGSMAGQPISDTLAATANLIDQLGPTDEVALITFSDQAVVSVPLTPDKAAAKAALATLKPRGNTALWDGVHEALGALAIRPSGRRAVIVVTDGQDTSSLLKLEDVSGEAVRQLLPIFPIGFGSVDQAALTRLGELTGGEASTKPSSAELTAQYDLILERLRQQYLITFTTQALADGGDHPVIVRVNYQGIEAEAEASFYAQSLEFTLELPALTDGQTVGAGLPLRLEPKFSERAAIASVDYELEGVKLSSVTIPPFEYVWTPAQADQGKRTFIVRATDKTGQTQEKSIAVAIVPALTVTISAPQADESLAGTVTLLADVQALSTVADVEFLVDDKSIGIVSAAPYAVEWDTAAVAPGAHTLTVVVRDTAGQTATAESPFRVQAGINWGVFIVVAVVIAAVGLILPIGFRRRRQASAPLKAGSAGPVPGPMPATTSEAWLILEAGNGQGQRWPLAVGETRIGRQRAENDVILAGTEVSRKHALIRAAGGDFVYINLSQTTVSLINGEPVTSQCRLEDGDRIEIGPFALRFVGPKVTPSR